MDRREYLRLLAAFVATSGGTSISYAAASGTSASVRRTPIVNAAEHAWVLDDPRFPINPELSNCPNTIPTLDRSYGMGDLLAQMRLYGVDKTVISHVCYYGSDNRYASYIVEQHPERFAAIGLMVGHRLFRPDDPQNPQRLRRAIQEENLIGLRLSPRYDPDVVWLNDPVSYPLWREAEELGAVFNIFLSPHQIGQVADMAERFPGVKVVIDHWAMMDITRPDSEGIDQILAMQRLPNVYIRTSLHNPSREPIPYHDMWPYLHRAYDTFGPQRMIYANFHQLLIMKELIPFFTAEDKEWILGKTALEVYPFRGD
jgi:predicted TIM-barrel fold metal-dependent hydrolase